MKDRIVFKVVVTIVLLLVLIWVLCLVSCEVMTLLFGDTLMQTQECPTMLRNPEYIKVLKYRKDTARIYYVEEDIAGGHVLYLEKENGIWTTTQWETIWSGTGGSASDVVFPYIWHFIYGGL